MYDLAEWAAEYDFANAISTFNNLPGNPPGFPAQALTPGLTDLYARFLQLPFFGNLTIGNFKEPIGFEHLVNDRFLDFMERSYNQSVFYGAFNNGFSPGIMLSNWASNERATWALWTGPNQSNPYGYHVGNSPFAFTGRFTYLPIYDGGGQLSASPGKLGQHAFAGPRAIPGAGHGQHPERPARPVEPGLRHDGQPVGKQPEPCQLGVGVGVGSADAAG